MRSDAELAESHPDPQPGFEPVAHRWIAEQLLGQAVERYRAVGESSEEPARRTGGEEEHAMMTAHRARHREQQPELAAAEEGEGGAQLHRAGDPTRRLAP